jgi:hypothetical protein
MLEQSMYFCKVCRKEGYNSYKVQSKVDDHREHGITWQDNSQSVTDMVTTTAGLGKLDTFVELIPSQIVYPVDLG